MNINVSNLIKHIGKVEIDINIGHLLNKLMVGSVKVMIFKADI